MIDRVNEVSREVFTALAQVRATPEGGEPSPEVLHARMRAFVERAMRKAAELGFPQADVRDIGYALVALVDEVMLNKSQAVRDHWLPRMLQLQLFNENVAGEGVFQRLDSVRADPSRIDVLRIYYLVLMFGFQGKYRVRGGEVELAALTERTGEALAKAGVIGEIPLSPAGARPNEAARAVRRNLPLVWFAAFCMVSSIGLFVYNRIAIADRAEELVEQVEAVEAGHAR
jgi:type VI secretion system protein ImpK